MEDTFLVISNMYAIRISRYINELFNSLHVNNIISRISLVPRLSVKPGYEAKVEFALTGEEKKQYS